MGKKCGMEVGVVNSAFVSASSLPQSIVVECRFRSQSAFDSFCIASEAFSEHLFSLLRRLL